MEGRGWGVKYGGWVWGLQVEGCEYVDVDVDEEGGAEKGWGVRGASRGGHGPE